MAILLALPALDVPLGVGLTPFNSNCTCRLAMGLA